MNSLDKDSIITLTDPVKIFSTENTCQELLLRIFDEHEAVTDMKVRQVCKAWKDFIDQIYCDELLKSFKRNPFLDSLCCLTDSNMSVFAKVRFVYQKLLGKLRLSYKPTPTLSISTQALKHAGLFCYAYNFSVLFERLSIPFKGTSSDFDNSKNYELTIHKISLGIQQHLSTLNTITSLNHASFNLFILPSEITYLNQLKDLNLSNNQLITVPTELGTLSALQRLNLDNNKLTSIPIYIGSLSALQEFDLSDNKLSTILKEIGTLSALQSLYLTNNQLITIPTELGTLSALRVLCLSKNQLTSIPTEIGSLSNLEWLSLDHNKLTSIPTQIGSLSTLQELHLLDNKLTSVPTELGTLSALRSLNLSGNKLTTIPTELGTLSVLRCLYLSNNPITNSKAIMKVLKERAVIVFQ